MVAYTEAWLSGHKSTNFYTRTYLAASPKAVVVFVHGFNEHLGRYDHVHPEWAARGVSVFSYDQRGFGKTATDPQHKSADSSYAKTCWEDQFADIEWAVKHAKETIAKDVPLFLMGHSMGGGLTLGFPTRTSGPPAKSTVDLLAGIIVTSPLILQTTPANKLKRFVGGKLAALAPYKLMPAPLKASDLSHDAAFNKAYEEDPLIRLQGTLRGLSDMLGGGEQLLAHDYQRWPESLPILLVHGTADAIASAKATEAFHDKLPAKDKKLSLFPGGFHELQNEPDGVKEKLLDECITWVEAHLLQASMVDAVTAEEPVVSKL